jgi:hypothetical protein
VFPAVRQSLQDREEAQTQYKPKSIDALHIALGGLPNKMHVEVSQPTTWKHRGTEFAKPCLHHGVGRAALICLLSLSMISATCSWRANAIPLGHP